MKITDVEGIMVRLPEVRMIGDGCQTILIIKVHTDAGITGIGEAHSNPLVSKAVLDAPFARFPRPACGSCCSARIRATSTGSTTS